ncbi:MAG: hypothetical protein ABSB79_13760 [Syntrophales bacterium]
MAALLVMAMPPVFRFAAPVSYLRTTVLASAVGGGTPSRPLRGKFHANEPLAGLGRFSGGDRVICLPRDVFISH